MTNSGESDNRYRQCSTCWAVVHEDHARDHAEWHRWLLQTLGRAAGIWPVQPEQSHSRVFLVLAEAVMDPELGFKGYPLGIFSEWESADRVVKAISKHGLWGGEPAAAIILEFGIDSDREGCQCPAAPEADAAHRGRA